MLLVNAFLIHRLVRKDYSTFLVAVIHEGHPPARGLTWPESIRVLIQFMWPQWVLIAVASVGGTLMGATLIPDSHSGIPGLVRLLQLFLVGPYSIQHAVGASYKGFRLQAYSAPLIQTG